MMNEEELIEFVNKQFEYQRPVLSLWQTLADNFYPERADFTVTRNVGTELADSLLSSYPLLVRRDMGNSLQSMLRDGDWFKMGVGGQVDHAGQMWLDEKTSVLKRLMYHRSANFIRATKEGDHDYVTFGQPVLSVERNRQYNGLLFRSWHLRDCAWWEDETGQICGLARKWKPRYHQLVEFFGKEKLHRNIVDKLPKEQLSEADIRHVWMPATQYGEESRFRYVSIYIDVTNEHIIEKVFTDDRHYIVPRFQTISGSPYAYSPATVAGLPDGRMLQAMTHTLMEAGERFARPPLVGTAQAVSGTIDLSPDGITWADKEYDEKMGQALRPLYQDRGGFPIGLEMRDSIFETLRSAFYINKLTLPEISREMTAYEVQERMKQYRRENLPLFAPIEAEYNGMLCETAFDIAMKMGFFGAEQDIPDSLRGRDVEFKFESPLTESEEEKKANRFGQVSDMLARAIEISPGVEHNLNFDEAFRDAVTGIGSPEKWLNGVEHVAEIREQQAAMQAAMMEQESAAA